MIAPGFPKAGNSIWAGFGGGCETNNDGNRHFELPPLNYTFNWSVWDAERAERR